MPYEFIMHSFQWIWKAYKFLLFFHLFRFNLELIWCVELLFSNFMLIKIFLISNPYQEHCE